MDEKEQIRMIETDELHSFRGHTFQVRDDEAMHRLTESVKRDGILTPILAFLNEDNEPEVISGHRRLKAAQKAGLLEVPVLIKHITREDATLLMGDSNFAWREKILPSEKAYTFKAMLESMHKKMKGEGIDNCRKELAEHIGESSTQIHRYLRLTELIEELLQLVDLGKFGFQSAVEISYLDGDSQKTIYEIYMDTGRKPSSAVAKELHRLMDADQLTAERIRELLAKPEGKGKADEYKLVFHSPQLYSILGGCRSVSERVNRILRGLMLLEKQEKAFEAEYVAEQEQELERIQALKKQKTEGGGGDTYDW